MVLDLPSTELLMGPDQTISIFKPEMANFSHKESDRQFFSLYEQGTLGDSVNFLVFMDRGLWVTQ